MIPTFTTKIASVGVGAAALAQMPVPSTMEAYKEFGITGLLIFAIVAIWADNAKKTKDAQTRLDKQMELEEARRLEAKADEREYRRQREDADDERMDKFCQAIDGVKHTIISTSKECGVNAFLLEQLKSERDKK